AAVDAAPAPESFASSSSSSSSEEGEEEGGRTSVFGLPQDLGIDTEKSVFDKPETGETEREKRSIEPAKRDDATNFPQESGDVVPSSGRSAAMEAPKPPRRGFGGSTPSGGPTSGGASSRGASSDGARSGRAPLGSGVPPSYAPSGPTAIEPASRVA